MLESLKERVFRANLTLVNSGLVVHTWGNASGRDNETGLIVIKPSGLSYEDMQAEDMVVIDIEGKVIEGKYRPSTDTPTHLVLYKAFKTIGGIVHTHSSYATSWAQAGRSIPVLGTTHADFSSGDIPCTRKLKPVEIKKDYEMNTGMLILETLGKKQPANVPAVLIHSHGPFTWGENTEEAVHNAITLEEIALMAFNTVLLGRSSPIEKTLLEKHFSRKHGNDAYYGQKK